MRRGNYFRVALIALLLFALALAVSTCGGHRHKTPGLPSLESTQRFAQAPTEISIDDALADLAKLTLPQGVEAALFAQLKAELERQLKTKRTSKFVSAPPMGEDNTVTDLAPLYAGQNAIRLKWKEVNTGDYDLDGTVGISDITPIAVRFGNSATDGVEDAKDKAVDGNGDGVVNIADITPLAQHFGTKIEGFKIYRTDEGLEEPDLIGAVPRQQAQLLAGVAVVYVFTDPAIDGEATYLYEARPYATTPEEGQPSQPVVVGAYSSYGITREEIPKLVEIAVDGITTYAIKDEVLLSFEEMQASTTVFSAAYDDMAGVVVGQISGTDTYRVALESAEKAVSRHKMSSQVNEYSVSYHFVNTLDGNDTTQKSISKTYTDPLRGRQWGLHAVNANDAWDLSEGEEVIVAVIDTGVDIDHEDLVGRTVPGKRIGYSWWEWPWDLGVKNDDYPHGTHVAGIIAATGGNDKGVVGLANRAKVMPLKTGGRFYDEANDKWYWGFPHGAQADAIHYATAHGARVINMSLGGYGFPDSNILNALSEAESQGVVVVASAGNGGLDQVGDYAQNHYPSAYPAVLSVAAIDDDDHRPTFSNYGYPDFVDVAAPGVAVLSTVANSSYEGDVLSGRTWSGTSMAAPHASAVAAMLLSIAPNLTPTQVRDIISSTGTPISTDKPIGKLLNAYAALQYVTSGEIPQPPRNLQAVPVTNQGYIHLTWDAPLSGPTPDSYTVHVEVAETLGYSHPWLLPGEFPAYGTSADSTHILLEIKYHYWVYSNYQGRTSSAVDVISPYGASGTFPRPSEFDASENDPNYSNAINLCWTLPNGYSGYTHQIQAICLERSTQLNGTYERLKFFDYAPGKWGWVDNNGGQGYSPGTVYYYRLYSYNGEAQPVEYLGGPQRGQVYAPPQYYNVSGTVTKSTGGGLQNVMLMLLDEGYTAYSNSSGAYTITGVPEDSYTLLPNYSGWSFSPSSSLVTVNGGNVIGKNFTATDIQSPTVSITAPSDGASFNVGASTSFTATASDNDAVARVEFYIKGNYVSTDTTEPYTASNYTFVSGDVGQVAFMAKAYDAANNTATDTNTVTVSSSGATTWVHTWGGSASERADAIFVDGIGNTYVAGRTQSFGIGNDDVLLLKYSSSGNLLWQKTWGRNFSDYARAIAMDGSGNVYIAGHSDNLGNGIQDAFLLKYSSSGSLLWQKTWGGSGDDFADTMALDSSGNVYVAGQTYSYGEGDYDVFLLKYSSSGSLLWQKTWGTSSQDYANALSLDSSGNIYIAGFTKGFGGTGVQRALLLKYSSSGSLLWQKIWRGSYYECAYALAVDSSGNIYIAGDTLSFGAGSYDVLLLKYSSSGTLIWQKTWGGSNWDTAANIIVDSSGNVHVAGKTSSFGAGNSDALLLKYSSSGSLLWQKTWGGGDDESAYAVAVDSNGLLYLAGFAPNAYSSWGTPSGSTSSPSGTASNETGSTGSPGGSEGSPSGSESSPNGTQDTGGGGSDILVMKIDPSGW